MLHWSRVSCVPPPWCTQESDALFSAQGTNDGEDSEAFLTFRTIRGSITRLKLSQASWKRRRPISCGASSDRSGGIRGRHEDCWRTRQQKEQSRGGTPENCPRAQCSSAERCPRGRRGLTRNQLYPLGTGGSNPSLSAITIVQKSRLPRNRLMRIEEARLLTADSVLIAPPHAASLYP